MQQSDHRVKEVTRTVQRLQVFYENIIQYFIIVLALLVINLLTSDYYWFVWPAVGLGINIAIQSAKMFGKNSIFNESWKEKEIKKRLEKSLAH